MEWRKRPEFNWCSNCWFSADIESSINKDGIERILCRNCGVTVSLFPNQEKPKDIPRFFSDKEWEEYWEINFKGA